MLYYPVMEAFLFLALIIIGGVVVLWVRSRTESSVLEREEAARKAWRRLAEELGLRFVSPADSLFQPKESYVVGDYRGHHFKLYTFDIQGREYVAETVLERYPTRRRRYVYTRLVVSITARPPEIPETSPLPRQQIIEWLTPQKPLKARPETQADGTELSYQQLDIETNIDYLKFLFEQLARLADNHARIVALGGAAAPALVEIMRDKDLDLTNTATQLLDGISRTTRASLRDRMDRFLCPRCLMRCGPHKVHLFALTTITYYGCRSCHQSSDFIQGAVVAVLDRQMSRERFREKGIIHVNWLTRRSLFDFDAVAIIRASDEEVERFAVQVGNDTDEVRTGRYPRMRCVVYEQSGLSENSLRILRRTFGEVKETNL